MSSISADIKLCNGTLHLPPGVILQITGTGVVLENITIEGSGVTGLALVDVKAAKTHLINCTIDMGPTPAALCCGVQISGSGSAVLFGCSIKRASYLGVTVSWGRWVSGRRTALPVLAVQALMQQTLLHTMSRLKLINVANVWPPWDRQMRCRFSTPQAQQCAQTAL